MLELKHHFQFVCVFGAKVKRHIPLRADGHAAMFRKRQHGNDPADQVKQSVVCRTQQVEHQPGGGIGEIKTVISIRP